MGLRVTQSLPNKGPLLLINILEYFPSVEGLPTGRHLLSGVRGRGHSEEEEEEERLACPSPVSSGVGFYFYTC